MTNDEIISVVSDLNADIFNKLRYDAPYVEFKSIGHRCLIMFGDTVLWDSDDDERNINDATQDYEPDLLTFVKGNLISGLRQLLSVWE